ncbi:MAG: type II secretion system minor pseudopilin GspK [Rhodospirillaceae bacterium]
MTRSPDERGVALLVVLLLLTVLSSVAVAVTDDIRFAIRRAANIRLNQQAVWYARGAETLAHQALWRSWKQSPSRSTLLDPWARQDIAFPIDGGAITTAITDGGNCFNLNSVVDRGAKGEFAGRAAGRRQYAQLLTALDIPADQSGALVASLVDWIDSDASPGGQGAEDYTYGVAEVPYRTGAALIAEPSELRAIAGYSEEVYQRLRPYVCAHPTVAPSRLNVNTLTENQAALLVMLTEGKLRPSEAARMLARKPAGGYVDMEAFLAQDAFTGIELDAAARSQLGLRTQFFTMETAVDFHDAHLTTTLLLEVGSNGRVTTLARRQGRMD